MDWAMVIVPKSVPNGPEMSHFPPDGTFFENPGTLGFFPGRFPIHPWAHFVFPVLPLAVPRS